LVEQHQARLRGEGEADLERALLAVREGARELRLLAGKAELREEAARFVEEHALGGERPPEGEARAAARLHRRREVVEHAEAPEDARDLVAAREAGVHALVRGEGGDS